MRPARYYCSAALLKKITAFRIYFDRIMHMRYFWAVENQRKHIQKKIPTWASAWRGLAISTDPRLLLVLVSLCGTLAWLLPAATLVVFLPPALLSAATVCAASSGGRTAVLSYSGFVLFWGLSYFLLQLWEHWGQGAALPILYDAFIFAARLFCIFGFAALLPLALSPVTIGRSLTWFIQRLALLEGRFCRTVLRGKLRPRLMEAAWKAGLGLSIMASFLPRTFNVLRELSRTLKVRAPHLPLTRRMSLLGLAGLRILGTQTWDMAISIAARNLYRPEPWGWQPPVRPE